VLPTDYHQAVAEGRYRKGPVLAGNTFEEGKLFGSAVNAFRPDGYDRFTMQYCLDPDRPAQYPVRDFITDEYLPVDKPGGWNDAADERTDAIFTGIIHDSLNTLQAAGHQQLYYYQFGWNQEPAPFNEVYGSVHAIDLPFVF